MSFIRNSLLIVVSAILISGCVSKASLQQEMTPQKTTIFEPIENAIEQSTVIATLQNTFTPTPEAQISPTHSQVPSRTAKPTQTLTAEMQVTGASTSIHVCPGRGVAEPIGKSGGIPGTILYQKTVSRGRLLGLYTVGGTPIKQGTLPFGETPDVFVFGVSPDGQWLAYSPIEKTSDNQTYFDHPSIILLRADGKRMEHVLDLSWPKSLIQTDYQLDEFVWGYWINDQLIFTMINSKIPGDYQYHVGLYYVAVLDPFQGSWQTQVNLPSQTGWLGASFSPDMSRLLQDDKGIMLRDLTGEMVHPLWRQEPAEFATLSSVRWAPNSSWAVFAAKIPYERRLFLISQDGKQFKEIQNPEISTFFKDFYWSPNSQYFAFISVQEQENAPERDNLLVFDTQKSAFILKCPILNEHLPLAELMWSPDSSWIAISQLGATLHLLNITDGQMVDLNINGAAVGWSDKFLVVSPK